MFLMAEQWLHIKPPISLKLKVNVQEHFRFFEKYFNFRWLPLTEFLFLKQQFSYMADVFLLQMNFLLYFLLFSKDLNPKVNLFKGLLFEHNLSKRNC